MDDQWNLLLCYGLDERVEFPFPSLLVQIDQGSTDTDIGINDGLGVAASTNKRLVFFNLGNSGDAPIFPTPEDAPFPIQTSLYGASKIAAEGLLTAYSFGYGFKTWIFRFVSLLGPRYSHGHIIDFWRKLRKDPGVLEVLGDGHQKKSYLHVSDCVRAMLVAIDGVPDASLINIFNLGHPGMLEVNESIRVICRELGIKPELRYSGGERGWIGDAPRILLDTRKIESLGWAPTKTIEESVVETLRFIEANPFLHAPSAKRA